MKQQKLLDIEEALEVLWKNKQCNQKDKKTLQADIANWIGDKVYEDLIAQKFIYVDGDNIELTKEGEETGRSITRRHRLTERLLADVLEVKGEDVDKVACEFEHIISADVTDSICTLLGHPKMCPHGLAIPPGNCCEKSSEKVGSIVMPLTKLTVGESAMVAYIVTANHPHLHKLLSMGIVPGTRIHLHQNSPSFVIDAGETQIALDADMAGQIYVRKK
jgi:DtxR family transcriptional regulator, Mn-dependent transcriptional regulator